MPSNRDKKLAIREKQILQAALRLIERDGFAELTMDALAAEAGIAKATLYQHFANKEDLAVRSALRAFENLEAFVARLSGRAIVQLQAVFRYMMTAGQDPDAFPNSVMQPDMLVLFRDNAELQAHFFRIYATFRGMIEAAKADGDIVPTLNNDIIINMLMGTAGLLKPNITPSSTYSADEALAQGLQILFRGLHP
jgi:AcrR family transcriptional regulator